MRILIAYDGSIWSDAAIEDMQYAGLPPKAEARIVTVGDGVWSESWKFAANEHERLAERAAERVQSEFPGWDVTFEGLWGSPAKIVLETSRWFHPDLLVVGSHGRSRAGRFLLGSVSTELIHKATCSVRVARHPARPAPRPLRIVVGNDGSAEADAVIRAVRSRSWPGNTEVRIVSVVETLVPTVSALDANTFEHEHAFEVIRDVDDRNRRRLRDNVEHAADLLRETGLAVIPSVRDGDARQWILAEADTSSADSIFIGARGLGRMHRLLLGSVSSYVVNHAHCTVEVAREKAVQQELARTGSD
jgi:nucleotide-binding universal stress UspA family protein